MPNPLAKSDVFSVAMSRDVHRQAEDHLLRYVRAGERQENLCFALWRPSVGKGRTTALVHRLVLPQQDEIELAGNVSFAAPYLDRASRIAAQEESGLVLMHNHFGPGWQDMSADDLETEASRSAFTTTATGLPLVGLTLGTDGAWSGRFWLPTAPKRYSRHWCRNVRVVGPRLRSTFHPQLASPPAGRDELLRTISAWGAENQAALARTHVGVVGLGSVGRLVLESLARMGVERVTLIDFDRIERVNLDRLLGAFPEDIGRMKVDAARDGFLRAATAGHPLADAVTFAVTEPDGFAAALDCDVLFSCVDRPWGRQVLNHLAYAHLIPVVDGGILIRTANGRFKSANWSVQTVGPDRCCLQCSKRFEPGLVDAERRGLLDDPSYIDGIPEDERAAASQNVFPFSMCVAGHEIVQFVALVTALLDRPDLGEQRYHYNLGEMKVEERECEAGCLYADRIATGDALFPRATMTGVYGKAEESRKAVVAEPATSDAPRPWYRRLSDRVTGFYKSRRGDRVEKRG